MALLLLLLFTNVLFYEYDECLAYDLTLHPVSAKSPIMPPHMYFVRVEETLNITCKVTSEENKPTPHFNMTWHLPAFPHNSPYRVQQIQSWNEVNLLVHNLQERDSGNYTCEARIDDKEKITLTVVARINVKNKKPNCLPEKSFLCSNGLCILKRYKCDGRADCKDGGDEAPVLCGLNPCEGKQLCDDGRCIPTSWCCDEFQDPNCNVSIKPSCCPKLLLEHDPSMYDELRINDMGFLQTTIYTVIGCATAFMFIVSILVIAICRVHMKRSLLSRCPAGSRLGGNFPPSSLRGVGHPHHHLPLYDLDVFLERSSFPGSDLSSPGPGPLLVTYNINNGVQFVGRPVDPPPYCEVVASPPREGPPPPYASRESLARAMASATSVTPQSEDDEAEVASEGDSLLAGADVSTITANGTPPPLIRQSGSTLQVTIVHPAAPSSCATTPDSLDEAESPFIAGTNVEEFQPLLDGSVSAPPQPSKIPEFGSPESPPSGGCLRESFIGLRDGGSMNNAIAAPDAKMSRALRIREEFLNRGNSGPQSQCGTEGAVVTVGEPH